MRSISSIREITQQTERTYEVEFEDGNTFEFTVVFDQGEWALQGEDRARYSQCELEEILKIIKGLN